MEIEIDFMVADGQTPEQALGRMVKWHEGLMTSIIKQVGPTGWPVAWVSGSVEAVTVFASTWGYEV